MTQIEALAFTVGCELLVVLYLLHSEKQYLRITLVTLFASLLTHPFAWHFSSLLLEDEYFVGVIVIELMVIFLEALWYWCWLPIPRIRALTVSLFANITSLFAGWFLLSN